MSLIISTATIAGLGGLSGEFWWRADGDGAFKRSWLPNECAALAQNPSHDTYAARHYYVGGHTANLLIDEHFRCLRQGIPAPPNPPTVSATAGSTSQICYLRFYDEVTGERSPLSGGTAITGSETRAWSSIPTELPSEQVTLYGVCTVAVGVVTGTGATIKTNFQVLKPGDRVAISTDLTRWGRVRNVTSASTMTIDDAGMAGVGVALVAKIKSRCSHVELWVSVEGSLPRLIMRLRLGSTSITETTEVLALGEAETSSFTAMPIGSMNVIFNKRQYIAGVRGHEDTLYPSALGYPERSEGLAFKTEYGEPITGLLRHRKILIVLTPDSSYYVSGFTDDDLALDTLDASYGGYGHLTNAVGNGIAYIPSKEGVSAFNGAFHPIIPKRNSEFRKDYALYQPAFDLGFCVANPNDDTFQLYPRGDKLTYPTDKAWVYVCNYNSVGAQSSGSLSPGEWTSDTHQISDTDVTTAAYVKAPGGKTGLLYLGMADGKLYVEDMSGAVAFPGTSIWTLWHNVFNDPGGARDEGHTLTRLWSYLRSELAAWTVKLYFGDERAYPKDRINGAQNEALQATFVWKDDVAASYREDVDGTIYAAKTVHIHPTFDKQGRGFSAEYRVLHPIDLEFMGHGGEYRLDGRATRYPVFVPSE